MEDLLFSKILLKVKELESSNLLKFILKEIKDGLNLKRVSLFEVKYEKEEFFLAYGEPPEKHGIGQCFPFHLASHKHLKEAIERKEIVQKIEPGLDPDFSELRNLIYIEGITAFLVVPIIFNEEVTWLLVLDAIWPRNFFTEEEKVFVSACANLVSLILEREKKQKEFSEKETLCILGRTAAEAFHRLRNPLTAVGGFAKRLERMIENPEQKKDAQLIVENVLKMEEILNQLLKFSRPKKMNVLKTDINQLIEEMQEIVKELIANKDIKIECQLESLPTIFVNPDEIKDVLFDILKNAVEAIKEKGNIFIKTRRNDRWIDIKIVNNGGSIDKEILEEIFNPFFTTKPGGTGLGLAIANSIVSAYGGEIKVENNEPHLTTFIIRLPIQNERR